MTRPCWSAARLQHGTDADGTGVVMVVDTPIPSDPEPGDIVQIPGTVPRASASHSRQSRTRRRLVGTTLLVAGSPVTGFTGDLVLTTLDLTDPQNPTIVATVPHEPPRHWGTLSPWGTISSLPQLGETRPVSKLVIFNATDPNDPSCRRSPSPTAIDGGIVSGNQLYTTSSSGLLIYNLTARLVNAGDAQVTIPTGNGVSIVPGSVQRRAEQHGDGHGRPRRWNGTSSSARATPARRSPGRTAVTGLAAGESLPVAQGATVEFATSPARLRTTVDIDP